MQQRGIAQDREDLAYVGENRTRDRGKPSSRHGEDICWLDPENNQYIAAESAQPGNGLFVPLLLFTCFMIQFNLQWRKASPNDFSFLVNEPQTNTWMYRVNDVTMKVISNVLFHV